SRSFSGRRSPRSAPPITAARKSASAAPTLAAPKPGKKPSFVSRTESPSNLSNHYRFHSHGFKIVQTKHTVQSLQAAPRLRRGDRLEAGEKPLPSAQEIGWAKQPGAHHLSPQGWWPQTQVSSHRLQTLPPRRGGEGGLH